MLSAVFVVEGIESLRNPGPQVKATQDLAASVGWKTDPEVLVRLNGTVKVVAGTLLAVGKFRRLSALALIGSAVATSLADHRFWDVDDPEARSRQRASFLNDLGLLGGLLLEVVDTEGAPSLGWRARQAAKHAQAVLSIGSDSGTPAARRGSRRAARAAAIGEAATRAGVVAAGHALDVSSDRLKSTGKNADRAAHRATKVAASAADRAGELRLPRPEWPADAVAARHRQVGQLLDSGSDRASELLSTGAQQAEAALRSAADRLAPS